MAHKISIVDFASSADSSAYSTEDAPVGLASGFTVSAGMDKDFVLSAANSLQALLCLSHLMTAQADDPAKVRRYAHLVEQRLREMGKLICPMLWISA